jgi:uncharacterized DUF497 family protein
MCRDAHTTAVKTGWLAAGSHGQVSFCLATSVFRDPLALTVYDDEHSEDEERWATLGVAENGQHLVVIHTWQQVSSTHTAVRIISARRATKKEIWDYQERSR